jgi:hypothetical protein
MLAVVPVHVGVIGVRRYGTVIDHGAVQIMGVIVVVVINRQALRVGAEQFDESRVVADLLRVARAAHVPIQANHLIGGAHHQMQVVGNHQDAAAVTITQSGYQAIQFGLACHVNALYRLIEHKQLWFAQ